MEIAVASYSLRDYFKSGELALETFPQLCRDKFDLSALELNALFVTDESTDGIARIRDAVEAAGCRAIFYTIEGNLVGGGPEERRKALERARERLDQAHALGVSGCRINLGSTGDLDRDQTEGVELAAAAFNQLLPTLREYKIRATIENHGGVSKFADPIISVIEKTDPEWIGACPDFGNFGHGEDAYESLTKLAPYAYHAHAKAHNFTEEGEEADLDYARILESYKQAGYDGPIAIEYEGKEEQVGGVLKTRDLVRKHW